MKKKALLALALASMVSLGAAAGSFAQYSKEIKSGVNTINAESINFSGDHLDEGAKGFGNTLKLSAAPGSAGYYSFDVADGNDFDYSYAINLTRTITKDYSNTIFALWKLVPPKKTLTATSSSTDTYALVGNESVTVSVPSNSASLSTLAAGSAQPSFIAPFTTALDKLNLDSLVGKPDRTKTIKTTFNDYVNAKTTNRYVLVWYWPLKHFNNDSDNALAGSTETYQITVDGTQATHGPIYLSDSDLDN